MAVATSARLYPRRRTRVRAAQRRSIGTGWLIATYVALLFFVIWTVVPFVWMILASIKTNKEIYDQFTVLPNQVYFGHYASLMGGKFAVWLRNSVYVSTVVTALSITLGALGAYAITRLRFAGGKSSRSR